MPYIYKLLSEIKINFIYIAFTVDHPISVTLQRKQVAQSRSKSSTSVDRPFRVQRSRVDLCLDLPGVLCHDLDVQPPLLVSRVYRNFRPRQIRCYELSGAY